MSPLSWPVLVAAAVLASPALWKAWVAGTLSPDVAGIRLLVCLLGSWSVLSVVANLARGSGEEHRDRETQRPADVDLE